MALAQLDGFLNALGEVESQNRWDAVGPYTGSTYGRARGRWQIMEKIYPAWAKEAGVNPNDYSPAAQERVARHKMSEYYRQFGSWDLVAVAWFAGPGRAKQAQQRGINSVGGIKDMLGTSVSSYVSKVTSGMNASPKSRPANPRQADLAQGVGSASQAPKPSSGWGGSPWVQGQKQAAMQPQEDSVSWGTGQRRSLIAPIEAAPGTQLSEGDQAVRDAQITQDSLGSIMSFISEQAKGAGGQVLDARGLFGLPSQEESIVDGIPSVDTEATPTSPEAAPETPRQADGPAPEGLEGAFGQAVAGLLAEAGGRVTIVSGRRSTAEQQRLYDLYKAGKGNLAAKPGTSNHEHGAAVDFGGDLELVRKLAPKYGLKAPVKGEPWHWELA